MAKLEYEIDRLAPQIDVRYSGNPFDPMKFSVNKALGRLGAFPPFIITGHPAAVTEVCDRERFLDHHQEVKRKGFLDVVRVVMPMRVKRTDDTEWFSLPFEPLVSISGRNTIVRRTVAKSKAPGTIKECWSQDDYEVTIQGIIAGADEQSYPESDVQRLKEFFDEKQSVEVEQDVLLAFGIKYLAIESVSFPHTPGINYQTYEIKAYGDAPAALLISM